jgi:hypothetical protein
MESFSAKFKWHTKHNLLLFGKSADSDKETGCGDIGFIAFGGDLVCSRQDAIVRSTILVAIMDRKERCI